MNKPVNAFEQNKKLGRGVNIIGYDPIWTSRADGRFQAAHFRKFAKPASIMSA
jgi:endoglucanase